MKRRSLLSASAIGVAAATVPSVAFAAPQSAEAVGDREQIELIVTAYFAERANRVTAAGGRNAVTRVTASQASAMRFAADRLDAVRRQLNALHGGYRRAATMVTIDALTVDGNSAIAQVTEQTDLHYAVFAPGDVDHMTYRASHEVHLWRSGPKWLLESADYLPVNAFSTPVTQFEDELPADLLALNAKRAARAKTAVPPAGKPASAPYILKPTTGSGATSLAASYDYTAMVNYARQWAFGRNSSYPVYSDDCTNFISQVMRAGGWATASWALPVRSNNANWFWGSYPSTSSYTWGGAENWYWFATGQGRTYLIDMWSMSNGDVLQYDYDYDNNISHTQVCTGRDTTGPLMTQHGSDYRDKRLTEIMANASSANAWKYAHRT